MVFRARTFEFVFPGPALVMGIVNVTPDSFSDGGDYFDADAAVRQALTLAAEGAAILDIGGESTRPGATPVDESEELRRVIPVVEKLVKQFSRGKSRAVAISVDTMKPGVARAALAAGASIINNVAGGHENEEMWELISRYRAGYILMHAPPGLHRKTSGAEEIIQEVRRFFSAQLKQLAAAGVGREQIVFDPGVGFGKNLEQNLRLMAGLKHFAAWQRPLLLGVSRKSFMEKLFGAKVNERLPASLACAILGIEAGAQMIRAHDVAETVQAIRMAEAVLQQKSAPRRRRAGKPGRDPTGKHK